MLQLVLGVAINCEHSQEVLTAITEMEESQMELLQEMIEENLERYPIQHEQESSDIVLDIGSSQEKDYLLDKDRCQDVSDFSAVSSRDQNMTPVSEMTADAITLATD